ncbi:ElyC/SanA/YdcF family protein [Adlercreutzia sp. R25]|uniref:ElyC/SanA/YdcF family protein n=1 Tax=Adlercreutzia shanghongiae TaxID=3111773 RepID=A0ABU6IYE9_9ACTN|nr:MULTISPECIES: ElyC/SanA/YdcF family protein [unclassified Adlercreutzia]MEC4271847.1 ElyC/SanA/YdcF family protein [Adlercreutzia sp. R25]MEC4294854.1 ElyC/SanA/YdcF family protein [Adlercreutzia sp. R22]
MGTWLKRIGLGVLALAVLGAVAIFAIDAHVRSSAESRIVTADEAASLGDVDCVLVLGCGVRPNGHPSDMLADRIAQGVALYENGTSPKLLMSGDHGRSDYDEVNAMRDVAVEAGVPADDVFMDHAGFSTYESMYRARDVFQAKRIVIVSQKYHLYRALYVAERLGLDAYGVSADLRPYAGQEARDLREILARDKDFFTSLVQPLPTFLGDPISLSGSGSATEG